MNSPRKIRRWQNWVRPISRIAISLADQTVVSGVRFVTSILIARTVGDDALGVYSIAFGFLLVAICAQEALVSAPFTLFHSLDRGVERSRYHASALVQMMAIMLASCMCFSLASIWIFIRGNSSGLFAPMAVLAVASPLVLLQEFGRRVELARLRNIWALSIDATAGVLQLTMLSFLCWSGSLTAANAYACLGLASAIPGLIWLVVAYRDWTIQASSIVREFHRHWSLAKWTFLSQLVGLLHFQSSVWLMGWMLGPAAAGVFAACNYVTFLVNPLAIGVSNALSPMAVRAYQNSGNRHVRKLIGLAMAFMGLLLSLFSMLIYVYADKILTLLYERDSYIGYGALLLLLGINSTLGVMHSMNDCGVWAIQRPEWLLQSSLMVLLVSVTAAIPLMHFWGLIGAAVGLLIGRLFGLVYQTGLFFLQTHRIHL